MLAYRSGSAVAEWGVMVHVGIEFCRRVESVGGKSTAACVAILTDSLCEIPERDGVAFFESLGHGCSRVLGSILKKDSVVDVVECW